MVTVLSVNETLVALKQGSLSVGRLVYKLSDEEIAYLRDVVSKPLPAEGILVAVLGNPVVVESFQPGGPPDPG